jgi:hypothetical protein
LLNLPSQIPHFGGTPFFISKFDFPTILAALAQDGVISVPLLTKSAREALTAVAQSCQYRPEVKTVGTADRIVQTDYSACDQVSEVPLYAEVQQAFQTLLDESLQGVDPYPFSSKLKFNSLVLQRYEPGQLGITPHRDSLGAINLIAIFNLFGTADFYRCDDRQGTNAVQLDTTPGNVIFLRAPGFLNAEVRPFHFLTGIRSSRYSLGLRQRVKR